jgi:hypothetical protein
LTFPKIIDSGANAISKVGDTIGNTVNKLNPLNNFGFIALAGLGIFAMMEFSKTPTAQTLASRVLIVVPM